MSTERILVYGPPGSGKSSQFLKIARYVAPATCYVIDSDDSYPRLLETEFSDLDNVDLQVVAGWEQWSEAIRRVVNYARQGDWVCVDRADIAWETVQEFYVQEVFGEEMGDWFLQARKEFEQKVKATKEGKVPKNMQVLEGDKDWQVINKLFKQDWLKLVAPGFQANLYVATSAAKLEKRDNPDVKEQYDWIGYRPTGQKHMPYQVHTVFYLDQQRDEWRITTLKDRGRKRFDHNKLVSLPHQYLLAVAGYGKGSG